MFGITPFSQSPFSALGSGVFYNASVNENATATDDVRNDLPIGADISESSTAADVITNFVFFGSSIQESATITDISAGGLSFVNTVQEFVSASDAILYRTLWEINADVQLPNWVTTDNSEQEFWNEIDSSGSTSWDTTDNSEQEFWNEIDSSGSTPWNIVQTQT